MFLQQDVEDQVELWWFGEPCISLLCYTSSVALVLGLGTGGVVLLSSASTAAQSSAVWRLTVGSALCILALVLVLKQLLSSAVQDMGCVRSRRRIVQLRSGGSVDPSLLLAIGLMLMLGGATVLLFLASSHMLVTGTLLLSCGGAVVLSVVAYGAMKHVWERRERRRRRIRRRVRVYTVAGQRNHMWRDSASSQAGLIWMERNGNEKKLRISVSEGQGWVGQEEPQASNKSSTVQSPWLGEKKSYKIKTNWQIIGIVGFTNIIIVMFHRTGGSCNRWHVLYTLSYLNCWVTIQNCFQKTNFKMSTSINCCSSALKHTNGYVLVHDISNQPLWPITPHLHVHLGDSSCFQWVCFQRTSGSYWCHCRVCTMKLYHLIIAFDASQVSVVAPAENLSITIFYPVGSDCTYRQLIEWTRGKTPLHNLLHYFVCGIKIFNFVFF